MGNIGTFSGIGSTVATGSKCSVQYGFENQIITITAAGTFNIWESLNLTGLTGTVIIQPEDTLPGTTNVLINGIAQGSIENDIYARSINPLNSVDIQTVAGTTELSVTVLANGFESC